MASLDICFGVSLGCSFCPEPASPLTLTSKYAMLLPSAILSSELSCQLWKEPICADWRYVMNVGCCCCFFFILCGMFVSMWFGMGFSQVWIPSRVNPLRFVHIYSSYSWICWLQQLSTLVVIFLPGNSLATFYKALCLSSASCCWIAVLAHCYLSGSRHGVPPRKIVQENLSHYIKSLVLKVFHLTLKKI